MTGESLLEICDDWVDMDDHTPEPKFIRKVIEKRISTKYEGEEFFSTIRNFLRELEEDTLVRRYLANFGIPYSMLVSLALQRQIKFPSWVQIGFASQGDFIGVLLHNTCFEYKAGWIKYCAGKQPITQHHLIESIMNIPTGYSREKLIEYYDMVSETENLEEMLRYIDFMKRNGMLKGNVLCPKRTFRATIRKQIRAVAEKAGFVVDESALMDVAKKL